ncbi:MAG: hypothetical protein B7Z60_06825 [Ferrovum sp. 37-45-19]|uniref:SDR family NAD(P)-dependent oxidoreductase n=1 Tax=Ferrovum sp. JA12 TaxID=1356299 RepID=UPI0007029520|nr:SDR family NAD(P)-dependent oxidoreductase [Ferrovum sp. JA12]OYV78785.1 MAG: hypothetical protein B7Z65_09020 [Ferrovum sp. 21-44-67]OYV93909.1 MAG: hypothetical protein B7Z60_06825 [Ferrovum sp. 37-45-19]OZB32022.1 MAG: hypothetical protein B7X47_07835 [Ferrovum sp. 34-44-207]HQT81966.1 SDR family NAD(P)-dependent oxidoreductase [Ferrovaceae bacterium]KRH78948.1 putative oxidoreductase [Ferrovum sp. JA12]
MFFSSNPPISSWQNKVIWIIGASSGIGAALTSQLVKKGSQLVISARSVDKLELVANESKTLQNTLQPCIIPCDIGITEDIHAAYQKIIALYGHIDLVIIASGLYDALSAKDFNPLKLPLISQTIDTNLMGYYRVLSHVIPGFLSQQQGAVAMISSVAGYSGLPNALAYAPTKAALNNLAEGLYSELHPHHIGIYLICPGFVATPMTSQNRFPMPALITPEQAALAIINGFEQGCFEIHFPKRFTLFLQFLRRLPRSWYIKIIALTVAKNTTLS